MKFRTPDSSEVLGTRKEERWKGKIKGSKFRFIQLAILLRAILASFFPAKQLPGTAC